MCQAGSLEVQMLSFSIYGESAKFLIKVTLIPFEAKAQSGACFYFKAFLI